MSLIKKIQTASRNTTTYQVGLLQIKAYRILKQHTAGVLSQFDITTVEWGLLGLLNENPKGMRLNVLAHELGVAASFISQMTSRLKKTQYFEHREDPADSRAKIIMITKEGKMFVDKAERYLREASKSLLRDVPAKDILAYLSVLESIIKNA